MKNNSVDNLDLLETRIFCFQRWVKEGLIKTLPLLICFVIYSDALFSQTAKKGTIQKGIVKEFNSNNKPVSGVAIKYFKAVATDSDIDGRFTLVFQKELEPGSNIFLEDIVKKGYEVVNINELEHVRLGNNDQFQKNIILAKEGVIDQARIEYVNVSRDALTKNLKREKKELLSLLNKERITQSTYLAELKDLQGKFEQQKEQLNNLAERFARTNFDDVDTVYQEALLLFKSGLFDEAVERIESINPEKRTMDLIAEGKAIMNLESEVKVRKERIKIEREKQITYLKSLIQLYNINFEFDKSERQIEQLLQIDSADIEILQLAAEYYRDQFKYTRAIEIYDDLIQLMLKEYGNSPDLVFIMGDYIEVLEEYGDLEKYIEASEKMISVAELVNSPRTNSIAKLTRFQLKYKFDSNLETIDPQNYVDSVFSLFVNSATIEGSSELSEDSLNTLLGAFKNMLDFLVVCVPKNEVVNQGEYMKSYLTKECLESIKNVIEIAENYLLNSNELGCQRIGWLYRFKAYVLCDSPSEAISIIEEGLNKYQDASSEKICLGNASLLFEQAQLYFKLEDSIMGQKILNELQEEDIWHTDSSFVDVSILYSDIAEFYTWTLEDSLNALRFQKKSIELFEIYKKTNHIDLARSYLKMGQMYDDWNDDNEAKKWHLKAVALVESIWHPSNDELLPFYEELTRILLNLHLETDAMKYLNKARSIINDKIYQGSLDNYTIYKNLARAFCQVNMIDSSFHFRINVTLPLNDSTYTKEDTAYVYSILAQDYKKELDHNTALVLRKRSASFYEQDTSEYSPVEYCRQLIHIGELYLKLDSLDMALIVFTEFDKLDQTIGFAENISFENWAKYYWVNGKKEKAQNYLLQAREASIYRKGITYLNFDVRKNKLLLEIYESMDRIQKLDFYRNTAPKY